MATNTSERLARIEETLKHIDNKIDGMLEQYSESKKESDELRKDVSKTHTKIAEAWTAIKVNRVFIGFALLGGLGGGASILKLLNY